MFRSGFPFCARTIGCGRQSNEIDYRGEKIKLTKAYADYAGAPIAKTFGSRLEASQAIGQIAFPGYGSAGFVEQPQADGSVLMGFSVEVPRANKERYFVFQGKHGVYTLVDDFVHPETAGLLRGVIRRGNDLVFTSINGTEVLVRQDVVK